MAECYVFITGIAYDFKCYPSNSFFSFSVFLILTVRTKNAQADDIRLRDFDFSDDDFKFV